MKKHFDRSIYAFTTLLLCSCSLPEFYKNYTSTHTKQIVQPLVKNPTSVVVCREKQCAPARLSMSTEYIYNSLLQLLQNNKGSKALLCSADPASHICIEEYLQMPLTVGITPAVMYIDDVKITDAKVKKGSSMLDLVLHYNVTYNGQMPDCHPAKTTAFVESADSIMMEDAGYNCKMTSIGNSSVKTVFAIDYIDLDYGYIGGYYSIGVSGPANGGGAGYMLMRLQSNAYPLTPILQTQYTTEEKEVMVKATQDMSSRAPRNIAGKPIAKMVAGGNNQVSEISSSKVEIFPIYKKKPVKPVEEIATETPETETTDKK